MKMSKAFKAIEPSETLSGRTVNYYHRILSSILSSAEQWEAIESNPCRKIKAPKIQRTPPRYLDEEQAVELVRLVEKEDPKFRMITLLLLLTGMRREEAMGLEWKDIDFDRSLIHILRTSQYVAHKGILTGNTKTISSERVIKVPQTLIQANLHRLDLESNAEPFRIAGQSVKVPVKRVSREDGKEEDNDRRWRYYTPDTLNPVIFQCNIMQTATLLKSFFYNYRDYGNLIPFDMAVDVWIQLSDYAKFRIQEIFGKQDEEFLVFLTEIDDSSTEELHHFHTENNMNSDMQVSEIERLNMAYKGGKRCKVWIAKERKWLCDRKIKYDFDRRCFYAVCYKDPDSEEKIYLTDQDRIIY